MRIDVFMSGLERKIESDRIGFVKEDDDDDRRFSKCSVWDLELGSVGRSSRAMGRARASRRLYHRLALIRFEKTHLTEEERGS